VTEKLRCLLFAGVYAVYLLNQYFVEKCRLSGSGRAFAEVTLRQQRGLKGATTEAQ
jgi:hypothetical protein